MRGMKWGRKKKPGKCTAHGHPGEERDPPSERRAETLAKEVYLATGSLKWRLPTALAGVTKKRIRETSSTTETMKKKKETRGSKRGGGDVGLREKRLGDAVGVGVLLFFFGGGGAKLRNCRQTKSILRHLLAIY